MAGVAGISLLVAVLPTVNYHGRVGEREGKGEDGEGDMGVEAKINKGTPLLLSLARQKARELKTRLPSSPSVITMPTLLHTLEIQSQGISLAFLLNARPPPLPPSIPPLPPPLPRFRRNSVKIFPQCLHRPPVACFIAQGLQSVG